MEQKRFDLRLLLLAFRNPLVITSSNKKRVFDFINITHYMRTLYHTYLGDNEATTQPAYNIKQSIGFLLAQK